MARILVCGTLAYDTIGHFDTPLTPTTRNVKLDALYESPGGCAMNITYTITRLGHIAVPLVYAGEDFAPAYEAHVRRQGIPELGIIRQPGTACARGIVLTGRDGAQFTAFHPGPVGTDRLPRDLETLTAAGAFDAAIIAPDLPANMLRVAAGIQGIGLRIWCPGQYAELLQRPDIISLCAAVDVIVVNRHEWRALRARAPVCGSTGCAGTIVITHGSRPVLVFPGPTRLAVPPVPEAEQVDPTGCGDAFVAGLAVALVERRPLVNALAAGIDLAGRCLRRHGAQAH